MSKDISARRKVTYYLGLALILIGIVVFLSNFATLAAESPHVAADMQSVMVRALIGMALIIVGGVVRNTGARGLAGGLEHDALDEVSITRATLSPHPETREVVEVKCRVCGQLNDEDTNFCQGCGKQL